MGFLTTAVLLKGAAAGGSALFGAKANNMKKQEERHAAELTGISNDIQKYQTFANAAIASQELQDNFISDESTSTTTAAAQGRRSSSGSLNAISTNRKRMLDKNTKRLEDNAVTTGAMLDLNTAAGKRAAAASGRAGDLEQGANLLNNTLQIFG